MPNLDLSRSPVTLDPTDLPNHASRHLRTGADPTMPAPRTVAYATTVTVAAASGVELDRVNVTATGNISALLCSGGFDGQRVEVAVLASGAARTVTIDSTMGISTGVTRGAYSITSGNLGIFLFRYSTLNSKWALVAATVTS